ncbi:MAG: hypothetical protein IJY05_04145 [Clostridia bacterium]|nr:hypothetical protein [Clostridia bacterium]
MKKFLRSFCAALIAATALFAIGCGKNKNDSDNSSSQKIDYTAEVLVIDETDCFAPCFVRDFIFGNEHSSEYFKELNKAAYDLSKILIISKDGEVWTDVDVLYDLLPEGEYELNVKTQSELFVAAPNEDGVMVNVPYNRDFTITVNVSVNGESKY